MNNAILEKLDAFRDKRILVIGDLMLDKYTYGSVSRVSPEAPVQVLLHKKDGFVTAGKIKSTGRANVIGHYFGPFGNFSLSPVL